MVSASAISMRLCLCGVIPWPWSRRDAPRSHRNTSRSHMRASRITFALVLALALVPSPIGSDTRRPSNGRPLPPVPRAITACVVSCTVSHPRQPSGGQFLAPFYGLADTRDSLPSRAHCHICTAAPPSQVDQVKVRPSSFICHMPTSHDQHCFRWLGDRCILGCSCSGTRVSGAGPLALRVRRFRMGWTQVRRVGAGTRPPSTRRDVRV
ncbi:hypothetical protein CC85DRAFT_16297 [Cutaneotrichosporon oleaginosum]|uniref:Uncharacterized protein n=1 Tax=Cutaneotrichosporon oleaginosum TaxID=879819 RepID=A0A0J0XTC5_9TREE|nr:uncharacterized protein CC85DRAFT_16297 [Cutaneotrichosporon oleaginosum]KLT44347.1 hypothetical protein CC85DRAFT_16297 [Cutaneotrichosporon oleaginosum]TXT07927.1 hypothetical protein COLE_04851 [Cutaneotrichosporon oleaginosum]